MYISETNDLNATKETNKDLRCLRIKNLKKWIIGQLNINSLRNKFDLLTYQIKDINYRYPDDYENKTRQKFPNRTVFHKLAVVVLSVLILIEMVEVFCYTLGKIYHQNF